MLESDPSYHLIPLSQIREPGHRLRVSIDPERLGELADSMAAEGLHQPIGLRGPFHDQTYEVVWGHRRLLAAQLLSWSSIPARLFSILFDPTLASVSENLQREDLTPIEEAHAISTFIERGEPLPAVARLFRRSRSWIEQRLALLTLPADLQEAVHTRCLAISTALALGAIDHDGYRAELITEAQRTGASAAQAETWAAHYRLDRERLISNQTTVEAMRQARDDYKLMYHCPGCSRDVELTDTVTWRFCRRCHHEIESTLTARQEYVQPTTSSARP